MLDSIKSWFLKQWKAVLAFFGLVAAAAVMYLRSKNQKEILDYTNKSHKEEESANEKARKDLVDGLEEIRKNKDKKVEEAEEHHKQSKKDLVQRKKEFVEEASKEENLENLAKDLADQIGADFVE